MKRKSTLLLAFLLVLYIVPAISAYDDISPDSIAFFSETLPDDVMFYPDNETYGSGYVESFADVGDWIGTDGSPSTDGDVLSVENGGSIVWNFVYTNDISMSLDGLYTEFRIKANQTIYGRLYVYEADDRATVYGYSPELTVTTTWTTYKWLYSQFTLSPSGKTCESLGLGFADANPWTFEIDYLRISPANESGWQHDGSTTQGIDNDTTANVDFTVTTDGDKVILNATAVAGFSGSLYPSFYIRIDSTTTRADIERDYYPFLEINITARSSVSCVIGFDAWVDGYRGNLKTIIAAGLYRFNIAAMSDSKPPEGIIFFGAFNAVGDSFQVTYDWVKIFSIANFTVTQSGATIDDYLYVDSGTLYSNIDSGTIELNHDPALSVASSSYSVYNLTTSGTAPEYSQYVSAWSSYSDNTRGATSGTVTDIKLRFDSTEILSAIKFIEEIEMEINIFQELFLSLEMWGYIGPIGLVIIGYILAKKDRGLGVIAFIVQCLFAAQYFALLEATPAYWWHVIIILLGSILTCVVPLMDKR